MNLKSLTNLELMSHAENAVKEETRSITNVVRHFREIYERKLYLEHGFTNMYDFLTRHFGYSAGSAARRLNAMQLVRAVPDVESKLESGMLDLTTASTLQSFFYSERKESRAYSQNAKVALIETCQGLSSRDLQKELAKRSPEAPKKEVIRHESQDRVRVSLSISDDLNNKLNRLRDLFSHSESGQSLEKLLERLVDEAIEKHDPDLKAERALKREVKKSGKTQLATVREAVKSKRSQIADKRLEIRTRQANAKRASTIANDFSSVKQSSIGKSASAPNAPATADDAAVPPAPEVKLEGAKAEAPTLASTSKRSRYIPARETHKLVLRDQAKDGCSYVDPTTGRRCGSTRYLQRDHHHTPYAHGGSNNAENLAFMCGAHNRYRWEKQLRTQ